MNEPPLPPWLVPNLLPEKPDDTPYGYGYLDRDKFVACSRETLIERCSRRGAPHVSLAWAPEVDRVVTVAELPFLFEAIRERTRKSIRRSLRVGYMSLVVFGLPTLLLLGSGKRQLEYHFLLLLSFAIIPLMQGWWNLRQLRNGTPEAMAADVRSARYAVWVQQQRRPVSWLLLALIVSVFIIQASGGLEHSIRIAGLTKRGFHAGDSYRFLTATLMHGSVTHIAMNALALFVLGVLLETLLGGAGLTLVFAISALGGSALSFACSSQTSVGASGGIMGVIGCLAVVGFRFRGILPPAFGRQMLNSILLMALIGIVARDVIDNAAHGGGLLAGAACGWLLVRSRSSLPLRLPPSVRLMGWLTMGALIGTAAFIAFLMFHH